MFGKMFEKTFVKKCSKCQNREKTFVKKCSKCQNLVTLLQGLGEGKCAWLKQRSHPELVSRLRDICVHTYMHACMHMNIH
jgi:hypothetical protein